MKTHTQLHTDVGGNPVGDCWRTALACLLDIDHPADVPHFVQDYPANDGAWWDATVEWVQTLSPDMSIGLFAPTFPAYADPDASPRYAIATGKSPRGDFLHAVVVDARDGSLVWDPHPDRTGLASDPQDVALLIPRNAS